MTVNHGAPAFTHVAHAAMSHFERPLALVTFDAHAALGWPPKAENIRKIPHCSKRAFVSAIAPKVGTHDWILPLVYAAVIHQVFWIPPPGCGGARHGNFRMQIGLDAEGRLLVSGPPCVKECFPTTTQWVSHIEGGISWSLRIGCLLGNGDWPGQSVSKSHRMYAISDLLSVVGTFNVLVSVDEDYFYCINPHSKYFHKHYPRRSFTADFATIITNNQRGKEGKQQKTTAAVRLWCLQNGGWSQPGWPEHVHAMSELLNPNINSVALPHLNWNYTDKGVDWMAVRKAIQTVAQQLAPLFEKNKVKCTTLSQSSNTPLASADYVPHAVTTDLHLLVSTMLLSLASFSRPHHSATFPRKERHS